MEDIKKQLEKTDFIEDISVEQARLFDDIKQIVSDIKDDTYFQYNLLSLIKQARESIKKIYILIDSEKK